jgi:diadenosine tetraphosphatase ApaH/serine/threonine PP2A family protein phosphatase
MDNSLAGEPSRFALHSLIPLDAFKALLSLDDREDALSSFVLIAATYGIEQYCHRRLRLKSITEYLDYTGDGLLLLGEYPVREVEYVSYSRERHFCPESLLSPERYGVIPEGEGLEDIPYYLDLKTSPRLLAGERCVKVKYRVGYEQEETPPDLASACLELAAWNMARYRGRRIGMTGNIRGSGKDGEHLEASVPENVRFLLEPYRRKGI